MTHFEIQNSILLCVYCINKPICSTCLTYIRLLFDDLLCYTLSFTFLCSTCPTWNKSNNIHSSYTFIIHKQYSNNIYSSLFIKSTVQVEKLKVGVKSMTRQKLNKIQLNKLTRWNLIKELKTVNLLMFLLMPLQRIHVISGKAAEGTYEGFSCVDHPYVHITPIFRSMHCVTLRTGPWSLLP